MQRCTALPLLLHGQRCVDEGPLLTPPGPPCLPARPTSPVPRSGKLFAVTTLMVLLVPAGSDVLTVPLARVVGVLSGVLLSALVSTFLLPATASCEALQHAAAALRQLAWLAGGVWGSYAASLAAAGFRPSSAAPPGAAPLGSASAVAEQAAVEGMLDGVLGAFKQAAASQAAARKEVYMGRTARGRLLLWLPAWPWADSQRPLAPPHLVAAVVAAGRACVRLLWMLHAAQADGFAPAQLHSLVGVHGQPLLEQLPLLAAAALQHTAAQLEAALQRMHGRGGSAQQPKQRQRQEDGSATAAGTAAWQDPAAGSAAAADSNQPASSEEDAATAVQALADAVAALVHGSRHNRAALYSQMAALQAAAAATADGLSSPPAGAAGGGDATAAAGVADAAGAPPPAAHVTLLGTPRSSWHDAGSGADIAGLLRWHSLEFILERLARHAAELQAAVAALAVALPA